MFLGVMVMKCPICGFENPAGAKTCKCGFFLDLANMHVDIEYNTKKIEHTEAEKMKCSRDLLNGAIWAVVGIILCIVIWFIPGPGPEDRAKFVMMGFVVVLYGLYEIARNHLKLRKMIPKTGEKGKI
jgi:hypothetical protein